MLYPRTFANDWGNLAAGYCPLRVFAPGTGARGVACSGRCSSVLTLAEGFRMSTKVSCKSCGHAAIGISCNRSKRMTGRGFGSCISDRPSNEGLEGLPFAIDSHWVVFSVAGAHQLSNVPKSIKQRTSAIPPMRYMLGLPTGRRAQANWKSLLAIFLSWHGNVYTDLCVALCAAKPLGATRAMLSALAPFSELDLLVGSLVRIREQSNRKGLE